MCVVLVIGQPGGDWERMERVCVDEREGVWRRRAVGGEGVCGRVVEEVAVEVVDIVSEYPMVHWGRTTWGGGWM